jgi:hypothetical protein
MQISIRRMPGQEQWLHLRGLAAARVAADDRHVMIGERVEQAAPNLDHRQRAALALPLGALRAALPSALLLQHAPALRHLPMRSHGSSGRPLKRHGKQDQ